MKTYAERLKYAIAIRGTSQSKLARRVGVKPQAIQYLCKGGAKSTHSVQIAEALNISAKWLTDGTGGMELIVADKTIPAEIIEFTIPEDLPTGEYEIVPRRILKLSTGNGRIVLKEEQGLPLAFPRQWFVDKNVKKEDLACVYCDGDSMMPTLTNGSLLLVNTASNEIEDGKIFALRYGDELRVKRLYTRYDGGIIIRSDNSSQYPDEPLSQDELNEHIYVIGKVIWQAGDVF